jgi:hypothetical protein
VKKSKNPKKKDKATPVLKSILRARATGTIIRGGQSEIRVVSNIVIDESKVSVIKAEDK